MLGAMGFYGFMGVMGLGFGMGWLLIDFFGEDSSTVPCYFFEERKHRPRIAALRHPLNMEEEKNRFVSFNEGPPFHDLSGSPTAKVGTAWQPSAPEPRIQGKMPMGLFLLLLGWERTGVFLQTIYFFGGWSQATMKVSMFVDHLRLSLVLGQHPKFISQDFLVSINGDAPKWMVLSRKSYLNGWFGGTPHFRNLSIHALLIPTWHLPCWEWLSGTAEVKTFASCWWLQGLIIIAGTIGFSSPQKVGSLCFGLPQTKRVKLGRWSPPAQDRCRFGNLSRLWREWLDLFSCGMIPGDGAFVGTVR